MSDSTTIELEISEGHYVETNDKIYKITEIKDEGNIIVAKRLESHNREYSTAEFSRILKFTDEVTIRKKWN